MRKNSTNSTAELSETLEVILQTLPDPKDNSISTIKDEVFVNNQKVMYLAQKSKGSNGFCWNIIFNN